MLYCPGVISPRPAILTGLYVYGNLFCRNIVFMCYAVTGQWPVVLNRLELKSLYYDSQDLPFEFGAGSQHHKSTNGHSIRTSVCSQCQCHLPVRDTRRSVVRTESARIIVRHSAAADSENGTAPAVTRNLTDSKYNQLDEQPRSFIGSVFGAVADFLSQ